MPGSVRDCDVRVCGISADKQNTYMHASLCGDVKYVVSGDLTVVLRNVLYLPSAALGMSGSPEPVSTVLVGGSKFAADSGLGLLFRVRNSVPTLDFVSPKRTVKGGFSSSSPDLFIHEYNHFASLSASADDSATVNMHALTTTTTPSTNPARSDTYKNKLSRRALARANS